VKTPLHSGRFAAMSDVSGKLKPISEIGRKYHMKYLIYTRVSPRGSACAVSETTVGDQAAQYWGQGLSLKRPPALSACHARHVRE